MPPRQPYLPPHQRRNDSASNNTPLRTLGDVEGSPYWQIQLVCDANEALDTSACPFPLTASAHGGEGGQEVSVINYPNLGQDTGLELLTWFHTAGAAAAGDGSEAQPAHLQLPATISKDERRDWHRLAEQTHCHSLSQGVGSARCLHIYAAPAAGSGSVSREAMQLWGWAQAEGGAYWNYSQHEIAEMLEPGADLDPHLELLRTRRLKAKVLVDLLQEGAGRQAAALLEEERALAWIRDDESGGFPIHIACWKGLAEVVQVLLQAPHVLTQRDGRRKLPLDIATERKHDHLVQLLAAEQSQLPGSSAGFSGRGRGRGRGSADGGGPPGLVQSRGAPPQLAEPAGAGGESEAHEIETPSVSEDKYPAWSAAQRCNYGSAGRVSPKKSSAPSRSRADSGWGRKAKAADLKTFSA